jgi:hypothetical protein
MAILKSTHNDREQQCHASVSRAQGLRPHQRVQEEVFSLRNAHLETPSWTKHQWLYCSKQSWDQAHVGSGSRAASLVQQVDVSVANPLTPCAHGESMKDGMMLALGLKTHRRISCAGYGPRATLAFLEHYSMPFASAAAIAP